MILANPLKPRLELYLLTAEHPVSEYQLFQYIASAELWPEFIQQLTDDDRLFQQHFLVMNALYQLHLEAQYRLEISPLAIQLTKLELEQTQGQSNHLQSADKLAEFYLDWRNLNTPKAKVDLWLKNFWHHYVSGDTTKAQHRREQACSLLEIPEASSAKVIRQAFKRKAIQHHPDKGGCSEQFIALREAYEFLLAQTP